MTEPLFYEQKGVSDGVDVVLIHGAPSSPASMWRVGAALLDVARVTNLHLPGYDQSPMLRPYTEGGVLDAIEATLRVASVHDPVLVAYSGGVFRALELLARGLPARGLVSLAGLHAFSPEHRAQLHVNAGLARDPGVDAAAMFTPFFVAPENMRKATIVSEVGSWFSVAKREDLADEIDVLADVPAPALGGLRLPVLARVGTLDQAAPVALTDALVAGIPGAVRQVVPGVGHAIMLEDETGTAQAVRDFVTSLPRAAGPAGSPAP